MAWLVCDEPVSAPWNYESKKINISLSSLNSWIDDKAKYIKELAPNHLVTIHTTPAIDQLDYERWPDAFKSEALDFVVAEDPDMRVHPPILKSVRC